MRKAISMLVIALSAGVLPIVAGAHGCIKGAAVGGVAGHVAGHHAVAGAAVGCAVGHHRAQVKQREAAQATAKSQQAPRPTDPSPSPR